ncbi:MAG: CPBP family intramembrane glutamic endopeptidase [Longimicrobiales bacterium]
MTRSGTALGALTVAATAVAWIAAAPLTGFARLWIVVLMVLLPAGTMLQAGMLRRIREHELPRAPVYLSSALAIWTVGLLSLAAARAAGFTPQSIGFVRLPLGSLLAAAAAGTAAALLLLAGFRALGSAETSVLRQLLPTSGRERLAFVALSLSAGVGEELAFRAFLIPALDIATGSIVAAVILASAAFGFVHAYQSSSGIVRATLLGIVLALVFLLSGSVLPAMIAHTAIDLIVGLWLARWLLHE